MLTVLHSHLMIALKLKLLLKQCSEGWVEDGAGDRISKVYKSPDDEDDDEYTWNIDFNPTKTGRKTFTVIAQGDNSKEEDSYDFTVTITER